MTPLSTTPWARTLVPPETLARLRRETPAGFHVSLYALSSRGPLRATVTEITPMTVPWFSNPRELIAGRTIERLATVGPVEEVLAEVRAALRAVAS